MDKLQHLYREIKCMFGIHELITYRPTAGPAWAACYQSDRCRGRTHSPG